MGTLWSGPSSGSCFTWFQLEYKLGSSVPRTGSLAPVRKQDLRVTCHGVWESLREPGVQREA